ncbi:class I SAM-dependent methyltransferase, partial [Candidatus Curtissbacteria bacterium]|nr:class I SAM-dependent methyltransferase [Candidatus Curtissbacteria bacterium]
MIKNFLPYDIYERHRKVGAFISDEDTIVDVGGELNHLSQFCNPKKLIVANLQSGDVIVTRDNFPFPKNSFDIATAIDVLEHVPEHKRTDFIRRLLNVASKMVILSFPLGTKKHTQYEKETKRWLQKRGLDVSYLSEHIKYGLPTYQEIAKMTRGLNCQVYFSGNIFINKILFRIFMFDPKVKFASKPFYLLKLMFNFLTNP